MLLLIAPRGASFVRRLKILPDPKPLNALVISGIKNDAKKDVEIASQYERLQRSLSGSKTLVSSRVYASFLSLTLRIQDDTHCMPSSCDS